LPWLPPADVQRFAQQGTAEAGAAIGEPGNCVFIATGNDATPLGFIHARTETSAFTGETVGYLSTVVVTAAAAGHLHKHSQNPRQSPTIGPGPSSVGSNPTSSAL
jgi:hypothetical protein